MNNFTKIKEFFLYIKELLTPRQRAICIAIFLVAILAACFGTFSKVSASVSNRHKVEAFSNWYNELGDTIKVSSCKFISSTYVNNIGCYVNAEEVILLDLKSQAYATAISYCKLEKSKRPGMLKTLIEIANEKEDGPEKAADLFTIKLIEGLKDNELEDAANRYYDEGLKVNKQLQEKAFILGFIDNFELELENGEKFTVKLAKPENEDKYYLADLNYLKNEN